MTCLVWGGGVPPVDWDQRAPSSPEWMLDPGRETQRSHWISTPVDLPSSTGQGLGQLDSAGTPLSSMGGHGRSDGSLTDRGPLGTKLFYNTLSHLPEHCFSSAHFPEIFSVTCGYSRGNRSSTWCAGWIITLEDKYRQEEIICCQASSLWSCSIANNCPGLRSPNIFLLPVLH